MSFLVFCGSGLCRPNLLGDDKNVFMYCVAVRIAMRIEWLETFVIKINNNIYGHIQPFTVTACNDIDENDIFRSTELMVNRQMVLAMILQ